MSLRIAIVNDLKLAVEALRRVITGVPGYEVAWIALDGAEAVAKCAQDIPDIILMDLIMPVMNGAEATRLIMSRSPCAILVVTASVGANASLVFEAMGHGAMDAVKTPVLGPGGRIDGGEELLKKISVMTRIIGKWNAEQAGAGRNTESFPKAEAPPLVVMGASTGGPKVVAEILAAMPPDFQAAMIIVQHVDMEFAEGLAEWLNKQGPLPVRSGRSGDRPEAGTVLLGGGNKHLIVQADLTISLTEQPVSSLYRPSVNEFFSSTARNWPRKGLAVLLTGMGRDGAEGLLNLKQAGWRTIAQNKQTSTVFGMPKAALELEAARLILPPEEIALEIISFGQKNTKSPLKNSGNSSGRSI